MGGSQYVCSRCRGISPSLASLGTYADFWLYVTSQSVSVPFSPHTYSGGAGRQVWLCPGCTVLLEQFLNGVALKPEVLS